MVSSYKKKEKNWKLVALPIFIYTPETQFGFGVGGMLTFRPKSAVDSLTRASRISAFVMYTLKRQLVVPARYTIFTNNESYIVRGNYFFNIFPQFYYGIGNDTPEINEELVEYKRFGFTQRVFRKVFKRLYGGVMYDLAGMLDVVRDPGGLLENDRPLGYDGYLLSGIGAALLYDNRDFVANPSKGAFLEVSNLTYSKFTGSDFDYNVLQFDLRKYFLIIPKLRHVLAIQGVGKFTHGNVPFKQLSELGGDMIMRGYYQGRYRDNHLIAFQAEYRAKIWKFIGVTAFIGGGEVAPTLKDFTFGGIKPNYGLGLRFKLDKKEHVNLRVDYGFGVQSRGLYVEISEAF